MFLEFFDWFCKCLSTVYETMDKFILFNNFSYFDFCVALLAMTIIIKLLSFIMAIEDEESYYKQSTQTNNYISQYDGYIPKHARRKRSWY